jgi:hypothetical protein
MNTDLIGLFIYLGFILKKVIRADPYRQSIINPGKSYVVLKK